MDYLRLYDEITEKARSLSKKPTLLLHSCCAPCSTSVIKRLSEIFEITVFYSNSNIYPKAEYEKRKKEQIRFCEIAGVPFSEDNYLHTEFTAFAAELKDEREGGARCEKCIAYRMEKAAREAAENKFDYFTTTLSVSPHKNAPFINKTGAELEEKYGVGFLYADFKKKDGYLNSIKISKELDIYRQSYCGCEFSIDKEAIKP